MNILISTNKSQKALKAFFSGFLILSFVFAQIAMPLSVAYAQSVDDTPAVEKTEEVKSLSPEPEVQKVAEDEGSGEEKTVQSIVQPEPQITVSAKKVVCDAEEFLPNWGDGTHSNIDANTAQAWVAQSNNKCHLDPNWQFQWGDQNAADGGAATVGEVAGYTTFSADTPTIIPLTNITEVHLREVLKEGFIPFTGQNTTESVSAEFYCTGDALNYDNWDFIRNPVANTTYHCVGFNAPKVLPPQQCDFVSDTTNVIQNNTNAIETWVHSAWANSNLLGGAAKWIWNAYKVVDSTINETETFTKKFNVSGTVTSAMLEIAADNGYEVKINNVVVSGTEKLSEEFNYATITSPINVASYLNPGLNTIKITVKNFALSGSNPETNPAGLLYKLAITAGTCSSAPSNTPTKTVTITKNTINGDGTFHFSGLSESGFDLATTGGTASTTLELPASSEGTPYTIAEVVPEGWELTDAWCYSGPTDMAIGGAITSEVNPSQSFSLTTSNNYPTNCVFTNTKIPEPLSCNPEENLIENGDFEAPVISNGAWDIVEDINLNPLSILKWFVAWASPQNSGRLGLEIQNHVAGDPAQGNQHAELDGDHPVTIWQDIPTIPGKEYSLTFKYSPRAGRSLADNSLQVKKDGSVLGADIATDGTSNTNTVWETITRTFVADSSSTKVEIFDNGTDTSFGGYVDDVKLSCTGDPVSQCDEEANAMFYSDNSIMVDGHPAVPVETYNPSRWTALIPGAKWIWSEANVLDATVDTVKVFTKDFTIVGTPLDSSVMIAADDGYKVSMNGVPLTGAGCFDTVLSSDINEFVTAKNCSVPASSMHAGVNTLSIEAKNFAQADVDYHINPAGLLFSFSVNSNQCVNEEPTGETTSNTTVVKAEDLNGWLIWNYDISNDDDQTDVETVSGTDGTFVTGPSTAPLGDGSFQQDMGNGDDATRLVTSQFNGTPLSSITELSYSTFVNNYVNGQATYVQLRVDTDNDGIWDDALFFEPVYQTGTYGTLSYSGAIPNQCGVSPNCVDLNTWQTWNLKTGGWWTNNDSAGGPPITDLAGYISEYPNAKLATDVPAVRLQAGFGGGAWQDFLGNFDKFVIGIKTGLNTHTETYDFEPTAQTPIECEAGFHLEGETCVPDPVINSGGGGGGGGGGGSAPLAKSISAPSGGQVLGASTSCGIYLNDYLKFGQKNNAEEVMKLQTFLNDYLALNPKLKVDGKFGLNTFRAVVKFQQMESLLVLQPWVGITLKNDDKGTGWVYKTTRTRINNIMCPELNLSIPPLVIN